jgi:hypothetical protein
LSASIERGEAVRAALESGDDDDDGLTVDDASLPSIFAPAAHPLIRAEVSTTARKPDTTGTGTARRWRLRDHALMDATALLSSVDTAAPPAGGIESGDFSSLVRL